MKFNDVVLIDIGNIIVHTVSDIIERIKNISFNGGRKIKKGGGNLYGEKEREDGIGRNEIRTEKGA